MDIQPLQPPYQPGQPIQPTQPIVSPPTPGPLPAAAPQMAIPAPPAPNLAPRVAAFFRQPAMPQAPPPPTAAAAPPTGFNNPNDVNPVAVIEVYSTRGVEYAMLTLCLFLSAGALIGLLLALVNGQGHFEVLAFPISLLVVSLPVFSFFFLRQKRAELANPALKLDPSKRRLTQFTQLIAFAACLFNVIGFVFLIFSSFGGSTKTSLVKDFLNLAIVLVIAGGILVYYWHDEHKGQ